MRIIDQEPRTERMVVRLARTRQRQGAQGGSTAPADDASDDSGSEDLGE